MEKVTLRLGQNYNAEEHLLMEQFLVFEEQISPWEGTKKIDFMERTSHYNWTKIIALTNKSNLHMEQYCSIRGTNLVFTENKIYYTIGNKHHTTIGTKL